MALVTPARTTAGPARRWRPAISTEALGLAALVVAAGLVRLPYLWSIPQFTDETADSLRSYGIATGRRFVLTNVSDYVGALYNYLEAGAFLLLGPSIYTPRLLACLLGALAVVTTFLLAREMLGRPAAWLAAALLATSAVHVGGNSHVAWSQETTPLFLALGLALLYRAVRRRSGPSLLGAGFVCGLALQTHPTVVAFLPGAAVYLIWKGRRLLRTRWPYLAGALFLAGYSNLIAYNLATDFHSLKTARARDAGYGDYQPRDLGTYLTNQGRLLVTLVRMPAGAVDARPGPPDYLRDPLVVGYAALTLTGLVLLARRGNPLPALVVLSGVLILPLLGARHELLPRQGRYLAPLLPLLFTALAGAAWPLLAGPGRRLAGRGRPEVVRRGFAAVAVGLLVLAPLAPLQRYYTQSLEAGQTNDRFFALLARIEASRPNGELVLLDYGLDQEKLGGGGTALLTLDYLLTLRDIPHTDLTLDPDRVARRYAAGGILVVLGSKTYSNVGARLPLEPPPDQQALAPPAPYGIYRLGPTTAQRQGS